MLNAQTHKLTLASEPYNEFNTEYLASWSYPILFLYAKGDPTNFCLLREISNCKTESFAEEIKHLIKFGEKIDGKWVCMIASYTSFAFWAYNIIYWRFVLGQGNYYLKQNPGDANLTLNELRSMVRTDNYFTVMRKLLPYTKNIAGINAYWKDVKGKLKATINQVGAQIIF